MKLKAYVHAMYADWDKKYYFNVWGMDMSSQEAYGPAVAIHEFDFEPPPHEVLVSRTIVQYREMQKKVLADAEVKRAQLEQKINELLSIEYKSATGTDATST